MTEEKLKDYCNELTPNIPQRRIRIEPVERTEDWIVYPAESDGYKNVEFQRVEVAMEGRGRDLRFTITDTEYDWIMSLCFQKG